MSPRPKRHKLPKMLEFAVELAQEAGALTLEYFGQDLKIETKGDATPVTIADQRTEALMRERIEAAWPDHGILGEEHGQVRPEARWRWILDPIDGTRAFIHGVPLYTVLIALEMNGEAVLGVIHNPATRETVAAATGYGCTYNGEPCHVSDVDQLSKARLNVTCYADFQRRNPLFSKALLDRVGMARGWSDGYGYLLVAAGRAEVALDPEMSLWDVAALKPIIEEAGGRFTNFAGGTSIHSTTALASNGHVHDELLAMARLDLEARAEGESDG